MDTWPRHLFPPVEERWRLMQVALSGPTAVAGVNRFARTDGGGVWVCEMTGIWLRTTAQIKAARALEALLDGGATSIIVPMCETAFAPYPNGYSAHLVPHSDGTPFSDDTLYQGGLIDVTLAEAAALRATSLSVNLTASADLTGGERFSINHPGKSHRPYTVGKVGDTLTIRPPLREATAADTELNFDSPRCVMRLANAEEFFGAIRLGRFSNLSPVFVESFDVA